MTSKVQHSCRLINAPLNAKTWLSVVLLSLETISTGWEWQEVVLACKVKTSLVLSKERWQLFLLFTKHRSVIACFIYWCRHTQVEEEQESRGGRRRTWDDEHVLKRQFSALVPAFDPRPGRTNIAQTQDIVIPAPGESLLLTNSSLILMYTWLFWYLISR